MSCAVNNTNQLKRLNQTRFIKKYVKLFVKNVIVFSILFFETFEKD